MELSARKKQILKRVIEDYIASAEPVGSKAIAQEMGGSVSSATVRNELAELSDLGYLEQPHTSAGRVPSPKGYRLYVNELMERREVSEAEAEEINETLQDKMSAAGSMISQAGQMASSIVDYPAYAVAEGKSGVTVKRFELLGVDDTSFITVVMTDDSRVKSQLQRSPLAFDRARLTDLSALLNTHFTRQSREEMSAKLMGLSDQIAPELFLVLSATVGYAAEILEEAAKKDVFTTGASQILKMPEYRDLDKAHDLMTFFVDNKENLPVPEDDTPLKILIGPENVNEALRDTSVVVASYDIGDGMRGLVGVVGPTRMDYATVTARLSYFADSLTRMFGKSELPPKEERISRTHSPRPPKRSRRPRLPRKRSFPPRIRRRRRRPRPSPSRASRWRRWRALPSSLPRSMTSICGSPPNTITTASAPPRKRKASTPTRRSTPSRVCFRCTTISSAASPSSARRTTIPTRRGSR